MIISASYKTDIPAFYGAWFRKRLNAGRPIAARLKGNRPDGACPHGCFYCYCYAVQNREAARRRYAAHDPDGEPLFSPRHSTP